MIQGLRESYGTYWQVQGAEHQELGFSLVNSNPANVNQIATDLKMDYKTAIHHLRVLSENGLVIADKEGTYGATYFLTPIMEKNYPIFEEILRKIGTRVKDDNSSDEG